METLDTGEEILTPTGNGRDAGEAPIRVMAELETEPEGIVEHEPRGLGRDHAGPSSQIDKKQVESPTVEEDEPMGKSDKNTDIPDPEAAAVETDRQSCATPEPEVAAVETDRQSHAISSNSETEVVGEGIQAIETVMTKKRENRVYSLSWNVKHLQKIVSAPSISNTIPIEENTSDKDEIPVVPVTVETMIEGSASSQLPTEVEISDVLAMEEVSREAIDCNGIGSLKRATRRHRKFDVAFKVQVVEFAEGCSNRSAGKKFGVDEKRVREWRKQKDELLSSLPSPKRLKKGILSSHMKTVSKLPKRNFDAAFKIAAIEFAETNSNRSTGREFGVDEKQVREWRKQKEKLEKLPPGKKRLSGAGRKPAYPALEEKLVAWIDAQKANDMRPSRSDVQAKAVELSRAGDSTVQFNASHGWLDNFFRRKHISLRQ